MSTQGFESPRKLLEIAYLKLQFFVDPTEEQKPQISKAMEAIVQAMHALS